MGVMRYPKTSGESATIQSIAISNETSTQKNFRRIINSRKGFITEKFVYERALPLDKPFFLEKTEKGLPYVAK